MNPEGRWLFGDEQRRRTMRLSVLPALILAVLWLPDPSAATKYTIPSPEVVAATPGAELRGIGSDGADGVWFSEVALDPNQDEAYMVHYTPQAPELNRVNINVTPPDIHQVFGVAPGLNGDEWFTRPSRAQVSRIAADGTLTDFDLGGDASPEGVVVDASGNVWITIRGSLTAQKLDRLSPNGELREWKSGGNGDPLNLIVGPDGNLWEAGFTGGVTDISTQRDEVVRHYPLANPSGEYVQDVASLGGRVWATVGGNSPRIEAISPSGSVHNYNLHNIQPQEITAGPDDAVWFIGYVTHSGKAVIGRLSSSGSLSKLMLGDRHWMADIAATSDAMYVTQDDPAQDNEDSALMRIPVTPAPQQTYVALGDSYSSGEGNPPYESGSDTEDDPPDHCHRSTRAYGPLLTANFGISPFVFKACSGAVTNDIFEANAQNLTEPAQRSWLSPSTKLVTLMMGGNDAGFAHVIEECISLPPLPTQMKFGCRANSPLEAETQARLWALAGGPYATTPAPLSAPIHSIRSVIEAIHKDAPDARIIVGLYPSLFGAQKTSFQFDTEAPSGSACEVGTALEFGMFVDYKDAQWLNKLGKQLNKVIANAVKEAAQNAISVETITPKGFAGHGFCDTQQLWFHELELEVIHIFEVGTELHARPSSFHPTLLGQQGYESAYAHALSK